MRALLCSKSFQQILSKAIADRGLLLTSLVSNSIALRESKAGLGNPSECIVAYLRVRKVVADYDGFWQGFRSWR